MDALAILPRYEEYKESGVDWLGSVPSHWKTVPIRAIFRFRNEKNDPIKTEDVLSLSIANGVTRYSDEGRGGNKRKDDLTAYKIARPNDIVMNSMNVIVGAVGVSRYFGAISPVYYALYAHTEDSLVSFYERIFQDTGFQRGLLKLGKGILIKISDSGKMNTIRMKISQDDLKTLLFPLPPIEEQLAISNFLDAKTAQIDEAIAIKEKQIALLKERKQITIQKAVTQGLNPDVQMKDSGVDWIGEIPEHWACTAVKRLLEIPITDGPHTTPELHEDGIPFISAEAIKDGEINFDKKRGYINESDYRLFSKKYIPKLDDIYMVKSGATTGRVGIVRTDRKFTIWSPLAVFRVDCNKLNPYYLYYFLQSDAFFKGVELRWSFGTQQNIGMGVLGNLFALAPPLKEQQSIVDHIQPRIAEVEKVIENQKQQIDKLNEYKASLINSAVTGKIKVA